jgi:hypothetical protein
MDFGELGRTAMRGPFQFHPTSRIKAARCLHPRNPALPIQRRPHYSYSSDSSQGSQKKVFRPRRPHGTLRWRRRARNPRRRRLRHLIASLVFNMAIMPPNPLRLHNLPLKKFIEPSPQIGVLHQSPRIYRPLPTELLPLRHPPLDRIQNVSAVAEQLHVARASKRFQSLDNRHNFHAVVRRTMFPSTLLLGAPAGGMLQNKSPTAWPGIPDARAICIKSNDWPKITLAKLFPHCSSLLPSQRSHLPNTCH